jgi:hypothetical protein
VVDDMSILFTSDCTKYFEHIEAPSIPSSATNDRKSKEDLICSSPGLFAQSCFVMNESTQPMNFSAEEDEQRE